MWNEASLTCAPGSCTSTSVCLSFLPLLSHAFMHCRHDVPYGRLQAFLSSSLCKILSWQSTWQNLVSNTGCKHVASQQADYVPHMHVTPYLFCNAACKLSEMPYADNSPEIHAGDVSSSRTGCCYGRFLTSLSDAVATLPSLCCCPHKSAL